LGMQMLKVDDQFHLYVEGDGTPLFEGRPSVIRRACAKRVICSSERLTKGS